MITLERTLHVNRPADQVFDYLSDFSNAKHWDAATESCTRLSGDGGVGSTYENISTFLGRTTRLVYVVQRFDRPHAFGIEGTNATVTSTDTIAISPSSLGSDVTYTAVFTFAGKARLVEPLLRLAIKRLGDRTERTLSEALERLPV